MPSFTITIPTVLSQGSFTGPVGGLYTYAVNGGSTDFTQFMSQSASDWNLSGIGHVTFDTLPPGFNIIAGTISWDITVIATGATSHFTITDPNGNIANDTTGLSGLTYAPTDCNGIFVTHAICGNFFGDKIEMRANLQISGQYVIIPPFFDYDLEEDGENVAVGDTITITSGTNPATDLNLLHLTLSWPCGIIVPITQTPTLLTFLVPESCDDAGLMSLTATGDGFQFSGPVVLGTMTVLLTNGSGIYRLVTGKRNDTYYRSQRDGTTIDIKIPNPTAKTGFVGG